LKQLADYHFEIDFDEGMPRIKNNEPPTLEKAFAFLPASSSRLVARFSNNLLTILLLVNLQPNSLLNNLRALLHLYGVQMSLTEEVFFFRASKQSSSNLWIDMHSFVNSRANPRTYGL
jgi:hypothetical protein